MSDYILYHHGIKGMRWGVRRFQEPNGTLTPAGRKRYADALDGQPSTTKRSAKQTYRNAKNAAFTKYEKSIASIEKGYKRGQMLSEKDQAREAAVEEAYNKAVTKAKSDYKKAKAEVKARSDNYNSDEGQAKKQEFKDMRKAFGKSRSTGSKVATFMLGGVFANKTYNSVKVSGGSTVEAIGVTAATTMLGGPIGHLVVSEIYARDAASR